MTAPEPSQPLTDAELETIRKDVESNTPAYASVTRAILFHEVVRLRADVSYLLEFAHEHWQNCPMGAEDCFQCEGYEQIRDSREAGKTA